jgi:hypothetical protein
MIGFFKRFFESRPSEVELFLGDERGTLDNLGPFAPLTEYERRVWWGLQAEVAAKVIADESSHADHFKAAVELFRLCKRGQDAIGTPDEEQVYAAVGRLCRRAGFTRVEPTTARVELDVLKSLPSAPNVCQRIDTLLGAQKKP